MKPIAVLGAGPAGLMAAHAVCLSGQPVVVLSQGNGSGPKKSKLGGAQFLHVPIPGINDEAPDAVIRYETMGTVDGYRRKVYGGATPEEVPFVSMENVEDGKEQDAWNLIGTYDRLWDVLGGDSVNVADIGPKWLDEALEKDWFAAIISTVPAYAICRTHNGMGDGYPHQFMSQKIQIANEAVWANVGENTIIYNGSRDYSWYRCSSLFGHNSTEWSDAATASPGSAVVNVSKPLKTNCKCYEDKVHRMGRNGTWTKGILTHDAFIGTLQLLGVE